MEKLLNKKFILVFLSILLVVGGLILIYRLKGDNVDNSNDNAIKYQKEGSNETEILLKNSSYKDTDNDGLKDWEEVLWKTNPDNPDTDGDGVIDGDEIKQNRNPTVAGPNDSLDLKLPSGKISAGKENNNLIQEEMSRSFYEYIKLKEEAGGGKLSESTQEELTNNFLDIFEEEIIDKYKESDVKISNDDTKEAIKKYGNELGSTVDKYRIQENEIEIFQRIIQEMKEENTPNDQRANTLSKLGSIADLYSSAAKDMLKISIPASFKKEHLDLMNNFENLAVSLKDMQMAYDDPIVTLRGLYNYYIE
ncbi:MAG: hypothetical protein AAB491_02370, partial [Patescibacteria group bacterium]